jgi:IS5 family transposase
LPELLERVVAGLTPEQLTTRHIEHEWTVAQNVHHVRAGQPVRAAPPGDRGIVLVCGIGAASC